MAPKKKEQAPDEPPGPLPHDVPAGGLDVPPAAVAMPVALVEAPEPAQERFPGEFQLLPEERDRWLILHFALPRTVMTCDQAEGRCTEAELNEVLASMAWGSLAESGEEWALESEEPTLDSPHPSLITYEEFVERHYPTDQSVAEQAREENASMAAEKRGLFTSPGEPGAKLRPMFDQLVKNLAHSNKALMKAYDLKKPILDEADAPEDPNKTENQNIMRFGRHQILPAFWQLLIQLTRQSRRFSIVFRSFSEEQVAVVQKEMALFCQGAHPAFDGKNKTQKPPLMSGDKGSRDMRLVEHGLGRLDRAGARLEFAGRPTGDAFKTARPGEPAGATAPPPAPGEGAAEGAESAEGQFKPTVYGFPDDFAEVYAGLQHQVLDGVNTAAIIDDLSFWKAHERTPASGKLLLVDHGGGFAEPTVQHIFFDGSMKANDAYCVDVRDVVKGESIPRSEAEGLFMHRVDLPQAAMEPDYFVRAVESCELRFSQRLIETRRVANAALEAQESATRAAALAGELLPKEYLHRNVIPALLPALEACQRDRPADPIEFIAFYMLRHSKRYAKTLKA